MAVFLGDVSVFNIINLKFQLYSSLLLNAFYFSNECHLWFAKLIHLEEIMIHFVYIIKISFNL